MSSNIFKISMVAATVAASFSANAALYKVYHSSPEGLDTPTYGVAISDLDGDCWNSISCSDTTSTLVSEVKRYQEGFAYRAESPFFIPNGYYYLNRESKGFDEYCSRYLGYTDNVCDSWVSTQYWSGYRHELSGNFQGTLVYVGEGSQPLFDENTVVNSLSEALVPVGNTRSGSAYRNLGFVDSTLDTPTGSDFKASQYWESKSLSNGQFVVGSVTRNNAGDSNEYTSKPTVWKNGVKSELNWYGNDASEGDFLAQGSVRSIYEDPANSNSLYAVGYTSDKDVRIKAAVFSSNNGGDSWTTNLVSGFPFGSSEYINQLLIDVNDKGVAIGTAKVIERQNGAYPNIPFYIEDVGSPVYRAFSGPIFFNGVSAKLGGINNSNNVVGTIDFEQTREIDGAPRSQKAFIAPISNADNKDIFNNRAWYLDDLTNGLSDNNAYRIVEASSINNAGIISGTAYYCAGGYNTTAIDATSVDCSGSESLVAVKLVPIADENQRSIQARDRKETKVERQGAGFGIFALTVLGLIGFRRK